jgi:pilus assembly protein CpaC
MSGVSKTLPKVLLSSVVIGLLIGAPHATAQSANESRIIRISSEGGPALQHLSLSLNKAAIIELDRDARDVVVANPGIADAVVRTPRRIFILALKLGRTNAIFLDANGRQIANVEVNVGADVEDLNGALARNAATSQLKAEPLSDGVVISGAAQNLQDVGTAQQLAARAAGAPERVVNATRLDQPRQVLIKVHVSEMQRTIAKQFGVDITAAFGSGNGVPVLFSTQNQFSLLGRALSDLSLLRVGRACLLVPQDCPSSPNNAQGILSALERVGLVRTLAEPNLTAVSGEAARFLAGGEFPVPVGRDRDGNIIIEFKQFGVGLGFTPVVLNDGRISLQISSEVSELTNNGALNLGGTRTLDADGNLVTIEGLTLPALSVRRTSTTVEIPSGGSLMIGGLLQQNTKQNIDAFPGLKDLPVLGGLFRSRDFQNSETELVVIVSAYLVDPVAPQQLASPTQGFVTPTDPETILFGRLNAVYGQGQNIPPRPPQGTVGYIVE